MDEKDREELATKMVQNFINNFRETFGVIPKVMYKIDSSIPTLNEIFNLVNGEFQLIHPKFSIDEKNRDTDFVKYRGIYYSIARSYGYGLTSIGMLTGQDHATVLHGMSMVSENSPLKLRIIEKLKQQLSIIN